MDSLSGWTESKIRDGVFISLMPIHTSPPHEFSLDKGKGEERCLSNSEKMKYSFPL
jgi:hypothetical protein